MKAQIAANNKAAADATDAFQSGGLHAFQLFGPNGTEKVDSMVAFCCPVGAAGGCQKCLQLLIAGGAYASPPKLSASGRFIVRCVRGKENRCGCLWGARLLWLGFDLAR